MTNTLEGTYQLRIEQFSVLFQKTERKIKRVSSLRLFLGISIALSFYFSLTYNHVLFYLFFLLIALFAILVLIHSSLFRKRNILANFVRINQEEIQSLKGNQSDFEKGMEYLEHSHAYAYDLDLFGEGSLYEHICRTISQDGKDKLAGSLTHPWLDKTEIESRQLSVRELKGKLEFRQSFRARGLLLNETRSDREHLKNWLGDEYHFIHQKYLRLLIYLLPFLTLASIGFSVYQGKITIYLILAILVNSLVYGRNAKKINAIHLKISRKKLILENYSELMVITEKEEFQTEGLRKYHQQMYDASFQLKRLANQIGIFDQRLNILFSPFANMLFLFDLHCCLKIEKWKEQNDRKVALWMDALGEIDALCSFANLAYNHPDFTFPEIVSSRPQVQAYNIAHPLLKPSQRVTNDFELGKETDIAIVTGANMAGKSTFLRTVGINLVLAFAGAPVCSSSFKTSLLHIFSSMRISDSLKDHTSYFYAELQRLKFIKENLVAGKQCLILLDEMLKGTNSNDKQQGSRLFVESLLQYEGLSIVATHDLELGKLEDVYPVKIKNYCFESFLSDNMLTFDYKIRSGMAQNTNASFLMKDLGII